MLQKQLKILSIVIRKTAYSLGNIFGKLAIIFIPVEVKHGNGALKRKIPSRLAQGGRSIGQLRDNRTAQY